MAVAIHDERFPDRSDLWAKLAAPVPTERVSWRQDGKIISRDGRHFARFVCYIEANTVRERLDAVVPGEWDLTLELLPHFDVGADEDAAACSFKARLQILGVIREDVGQGRDYKAASTDAFKRAAVRFGIGHELYEAEQNWVEMDGDGRYAKPLEDPSLAYARRYGTLPGHEGQRHEGAPRAEAHAGNGNGAGASAAPATDTSPRQTARRGSASSAPEAASDVPTCPKCGGRMWDNRLSKRNPKAPDFKCRDRSCDGVVWPPKPGQTQLAEMAPQDMAEAGEPYDGGTPENEGLELDDLPF